MRRPPIGPRLAATIVWVVEDVRSSRSVDVDDEAVVVERVRGAVALTIEDAARGQAGRKEARQYGGELDSVVVAARLDHAVGDPVGQVRDGGVPPMSTS